MIPTRNLVIEIRQVLASEGDIDRQRLATLVWEYASTCRRLNDRAQLCLELLRQGRRVDAVHMAQELPDLQAEILQLDFDERPAWIDLCDRAGMPISEAFDAQALYSVAQELYAETGALDHLLKVHRRMAIGGAPLADRLRVLRRIQRADPKSEFWSDDVRACEAVLLEHLMQQAEKADVAGDLAGLEAVLAQLRSPEWRVAPPPAMARAVEKIAEPHRRRRAQGAFRRLAEQLHEAHGRMDETRCRELFHEWQEEVTATGLDPEPDAAADVAAVGRWLDERQAARDEEAAHRQACQALEAAIDGTADKALLERLASEAARPGRGMPPALASRLESRLAQIDRRARRRFALILASIIGGAVLLVAALATVAVHVDRQQRLARLIDVTQQALAGGDLDSAAALVDGAAPDLADHPDVARLRAEVRRLQAEAADAQRRFDEAVAQIETQFGAAEKDAAGPAPDDPSRRLEALAGREAGVGGRLRGLLRRIEVLAKDATPRQKAQVEPLRRKVAALADTLRQDLAAALEERLRAIRQEYAALSPACKKQVEALNDLKEGRRPTSEKPAAKAEAETILARAEDLKARLAAVPLGPEPPETARAALASVRTGLEADAKALEDAMAGLFGPDTAIDQIRKAFQSPDTLKTRLTDFAAKYPAHVMAEDFLRAATMAPHWRAAAAWQTMVAGWGKDLRVTGAAAAEQRAAAIAKHLADFPESPHKAAAEPYLAYLGAAKNALAGGRLKTLKGTTDLLSSGAVLHLAVVRTSDGRTFYLLDEARDFKQQQSGGAVTGYSITYIVDGSLTRRTTLLGPSARVMAPAAAPQTVFAQKAIQAVMQHQGKGWETFYLELAQRLLDTPGIDPILAASILRLDFLPAAIESTPLATAQVQQKADLLADLGDLNEVHWMDPDDEDALKLRPKAAQVLRNLGAFTPIIADVQGQLDKMSQSVTSYRPVGILLPGPGRSVSLDAGAAQGDLFVLWAERGLPPRFEKIGALAAGAFAESASALARYPKGSPLFALSP